jgi:beta-mannanase
VTASFLSIALLPFTFVGSALRLPQAMPEIIGSSQVKGDNTDKILISSKLADRCKKQPCFGYYDYDRTLKNANVHSDIGHHFISWGKKDSAKLGEALRQDRLSDRQSMITLEPWPWAVLSISPPGNYQQREAHANKDLLKDIAKGKYDKELIASLGKISEQKNRIVYLRLMHEMDLEGQYPWSPSDPKEFINAYRHVVELSRYLKVSNIRWVWSPSGNLRSFFFWPGRDYVDYVGMSLYATPEWNGGFAAKGANLSLSQLLASKYWLSIYQKPIILAEVGINAPSDEKVSWLKEAQKDLRYFPAVVAWVYFNQQQPPIVDLGIGLPDWGLKDAEAKRLKSILDK